MERKIRLSEVSEELQDASILLEEEKPRMLNIDENSEIGVKVDELFEKQQLLKAKKSEFKKETEGLEIRVKELTEDVREYARDSGNHVVFGNQCLAEVNPGSAKSIDPQKLLQFLKSHGAIKDFFRFVDVRITDVCKSYGETILESSGVLTFSTDAFKNVKLRLQG